MNNKILILFLLLVISLSACSARAVSFNKESDDLDNLILATTTSTYDTGLLDRLIPEFEEAYPYRVKTIAVGSGEALSMGKRGEADVLLVHSPAAEKEFMDGGYGKSRKPVMYNRFVLVGPLNDPAKVEETDNIFDALNSIKMNHSSFISRGDESGTHQKELSLWKGTYQDIKGSWYIQSGQGMGATLRIADEKSAYTLTDEGTFLSQKDTLSLRSFEFDDKELRNPYSVIIVSRRSSDDVNTDGARDFSRYITSSETKRLIETFGKKKYGRPLFVPIGE